MLSKLRMSVLFDCNITYFKVLTRSEKKIRKKLAMLKKETYILNRMLEKQLFLVIKR
jgi:hypothetical protein